MSFDQQWEKLEELLDKTAPKSNDKLGQHTHLLQNSRLKILREIENHLIYSKATINYSFKTVF